MIIITGNAQEALAQASGKCPCNFFRIVPEVAQNTLTGSRCLEVNKPSEAEVFMSLSETHRTDNSSFTNFLHTSLNLPGTTASCVRSFHEDLDAGGVNSGTNESHNDLTVEEYDACVNKIYQIADMMNVSNLSDDHPFDCQELSE